jgi:signal transduction histidine kinase
VLIEEVKADGETVFPFPDGQPQAQNAEARDFVQGTSPSISTAMVRVKPGKAHSLEFQYTANTFVAPERARFRYRLVGSEDRWTEAGAERLVRYHNLRPGSYQFEVTAANHHGVWNEKPARFAFSLEPHFWQTWSFYAFCAIGTIALAAAVQGYRLKWQHRLLKLEEQRALANERARIARDLHDDLGTALTGLALQLEVGRRDVKDDARAAGRFQEGAGKARELADRMREVVWTINPRCDTVSELVGFLEQQISQFAHADGIKVKIDFPEDIPAMPVAAQARHYLALSVREALTNVIRHAAATEVRVALEITDRELVLQVKDNGRGFQPTEKPGHGLNNMRTRMEQAGGKFECSSEIGAGTKLRFSLPLEPRAAGRMVNK